MSEPFNWTCPFCNRAQVVTDNNYFDKTDHININDSSFGPVGYSVVAITCANRDCKELTIVFFLHRQSRVSEAYPWKNLNDQPALLSERLRPMSAAKPQPDYIPEGLRQDYEEACLIRDLSPKAAATLARRCLQGMIRDFAKIKKDTLYKEIIALRTAVEEGTAPRDVSIESVEAIDAVRTVGNIGAHMEKDVELIIPVDPDEAQLLIELVESLFDEWYVERHKRTARFAAVSALAAEKKAVIAAGKAPSALPSP